MPHIILNQKWAHQERAQGGRGLHLLLRQLANRNTDRHRKRQMEREREA